MLTSKSALKSEDLISALTSGDGTLVMGALSEIEEATPSPSVGQLLSSALPKITDTVLAFQVRKTIKVQSMKLAGRKPVLSLGNLQQLFKQPDRFEEIAIAISFLSSSEAILASDLLRAANWTEFPAPLLPTICQFIRKYGNSADSPALLELCRHPDPTVLTTALAALETVDPSDLPNLVTPLLTSPNASIRAQAIQALYRWDKSAALRHLVKLLFSKNPGEKLLALLHSTSFPYLEVEPHLLRFISECSETRLLMKVSQIMQNNAHIELPFKLYWISRSLKQQHQNLIRGMLLGVIRALADRKKIQVTAQEFHDQLKERVKKEEERLIKESLTVPPEQSAESPTESVNPNEGFNLPEIIQEEKEQQTLNQSQSQSSQNTFFSIEDYEKSDLPAKLQIIAKLSRQEFQTHKGKIVGYLKAAKGKEQAALIKAVGRLGTSDDTALIKPFIEGENIDALCAAIEALSHLDSEFLAVYLPQHMQSKHGKVRLQATRTFVGIDKQQIKSLINGMLQSASPRQRAMVIPATMLVDFSLVRESLIRALEKELSGEIIDKIALVFAANPDRELLRSAIAAEKKAKDTIKPSITKLVTLLAEKLSIALGKISTPEELIAGEEKSLVEEAAVSATQTVQKATELAQTKAAASSQKTVINTLLVSNDDEAKQKRAKITTIVLILAAIAWFVMLATIVHMFFSG
ncbi:MAG: HEAT repeat domain-containing protein [Candidatus Riflebacteria bacterium]|nr:HEAT repeat domain-containing protein [Candidatus Riflebacteria bacterium]